MNCLNCDAVVTDRYCARCGQEVQQSRPTVGRFLAEGIQSLTNADSRLWWTLWCLVSKPGFLTKEYFLQWALAGDKKLEATPGILLSGAVSLTNR